MVNNNLIYSGKVTITLRDEKNKSVVKKRVYKNAGTTNLFRFLCNCLIGSFEGNKRPSYLDASNSIYELNQASDLPIFETNLYYRSILSNSNIAKQNETILLDSNQTKILSNWHVKYSASILRNQLDETARTDGITTLALFNSPNFSDNSDSILAWINLLDEDGVVEPLFIQEN